MDSQSCYSFLAPTSSAPQAIPRSSSRRLRHSRSPARHASPDNSIPRTSLYNYTSDSSLAAMYAAQSPSQASAPFTGGDSPSRIFTAVIPPLAAVPPTAPLPPTPPMQKVWDKRNRSQDKLDMRSAGTANKSSRSLSDSRDVVVVEILKDTRSKDELRRRKKGLRRVKGNVAEAAHTYRADNTETTVVGFHSNNGLPTPGPTPPSSAKKIVPPRPLHHAKAPISPHLKLDFSNNGSRASSLYSNSRRGSASYWSENDTDIDHDEGGIKINIEEEKQQEEQEEGYTLLDRPLKRIASLGGNPLGIEIPGPELDIDIPRPDSPFITGRAFSFEDQKGASETLNVIPAEPQSPQSIWSQDSADEGVRLSAIRRFFPDVFTPPKRIDSDKAVVVDSPCEKITITDSPSEKISISESPSEKIPVEGGERVIRISEIKSKPCSDVITPAKRIDSEKVVILNAGDEEQSPVEEKQVVSTAPPPMSNEKILIATNTDADRFISRSSIAKRRQLYCEGNANSHTITLPFLPQKALSTGNINLAELPATMEGGAKASSAPPTPNDITRSKTPNNAISITSTVPVQFPMAMFRAGLGTVTPSVNVESGDTLRNDLTRPPQLPKFNFIPPTPLPLLSPASNMEKQLGSIAETTTDSDKPVPPKRPSYASRPSMQSKKLRESKLHPWWHPRSEYDAHMQDKFSRMPSFDARGGRDGEEEEEEEEFVDAGEGLCRSASTSSTYSWTGGFGPVRVDKKRKVVGLGGMQIEWVGLGGWYDLLVGGGADKKVKEEKEKEKEVKEKKAGVERRNSLTARIFDREAGRKRKKGWVDF